MGIKITIEVNKCSECAHIRHSGNFTPGGAKPICDHPEVVKFIKKFKPTLRDDDANDDKTKVGKQIWYWGNRVIPYKTVETGLSGNFGAPKRFREPKGTIPQWCPLRNGGKY